MLRQIIEEIQELHAASARQTDEREFDPAPRVVERTLANCLQQLHAIVAAAALDEVLRRPILRVF